MLACVIVSMKAIGLQRPASIVPTGPVSLLRPRWGGVDSLCPPSCAIACLFWVDLRDAMIHYHFHPFCERGDRLSSRS